MEYSVDQHDLIISIENLLKEINNINHFGDFDNKIVECYNLGVKLNLDYKKCYGCENQLLVQVMNILRAFIIDKKNAKQRCAYLLGITKDNLTSVIYNIKFQEFEVSDNSIKTNLNSCCFLL